MYVYIHIHKKKHIPSTKLYIIQLSFTIFTKKTGWTQWIYFTINHILNYDGCVHDSFKRSYVRRSVGWSVSWLGGRSVRHTFLNGRKVTLTCSSRSTPFSLSIFYISFFQYLPIILSIFLQGVH